MPPYIQPYTSQEQVQVPGGFSTDLPQVTDIGGSLQQLGRGVMSAVEPHLKAKAEEQAILDAGAASIVKTPEGGYTRANVTHGGGLVYAKAYGAALDERQLNLMAEDYSTQLTTVTSKWIDDPAMRDPKQLWSFGSGLADAMLQAAPLSIRADLDTRLARTFAQSFRGFSEATTKIQHRDLVDGLQTSLDAKLKLIGEIAQSNGDPADIAKEMQQLGAEYMQTAQKLHDAGAIGDLGPVAEQLGAATFNSQNFVASLQSLQGLGANLANLDDTQLRRLGYWGQYGVTDGGKVGEMDFAAFQHLFPSPEVARRAGSVANDILSGRIQAANNQAVLDALKQPAPATVAQVEADHDNLNYQPGAGITHEQFAAATQEYDTHGPVWQQLRDPGRMLSTVGFLAANGTVPKGTDEALRSMVLSSDPEAQQSAFNFIWNARGAVTGKGNWSGLTWFNNLPDDVKALSQFDVAMRRAGFNTTQELRTIYAKTQGRLSSQGDIWAQYPKGQQDYDAAANGAIATEFRVKPGELGVMGARLKQDFDKYMTINAGLYATKEEAMQASAAMLSTGWGRSGVFVGGIGDAKLVAEGIPNWFLDRALARFPELHSGNPTNSNFTNGRVKIQALETSPSDTHPNYQFTFFNNLGQQLGRGAVFPMQKIVTAWHLYNGAEKAKQQREALDAMPPPVWKLGHDASGKLRYLDNRAEYEAWAKRRAAMLGAFTDKQKADARVRVMQNRY